MADTPTTHQVRRTFKGRIRVRGTYWRVWVDVGPDALTFTPSWWAILPTYSVPFGSITDSHVARDHRGGLHIQLSVPRREVIEETVFGRRVGTWGLGRQLRFSFSAKRRDADQLLIALPFPLTRHETAGA
jgi:hypothetical protein